MRLPAPGSAASPGARAARGRLDECRRRRGRPAGRGRGQRRRHGARGRAGGAARRVLDRLRLRRPQGRAVRRIRQPGPLSAYGRTKLHGEAAAGEQAWVVRSSWLFGADRAQLRPDDAPSRSRAGRGGRRRRPARLPDLRRAPGRRDARARRRAARRSGSGISPRRATAPGPTSRRRSSRRRASPAA